MRHDSQLRVNFALILGAIVSSCGQGDYDPGPGGVTMGEARALDEAAEVVEQRRQRAEDLLDYQGPAAVSKGQDMGEAVPDA